MRTRKFASGLVISLLLLGAPAIGGAPNNSSPAQLSDLELIQSVQGQCQKTFVNRCNSFNTQAAKSVLLVRQLMAQ